MRPGLHKRLRILATLSVLGCLPVMAATTINVDPSKTFQTVEGIGAYHGLPVIYQKAGEKFYVAKPLDYEYDRFIIDLGASGIRFDLPPQCFPEENKPYDWTYFSPSLRDMREYLKRDNSINFIVSVWSPPCWMKTNGTCYYGGNLAADRYDDLAKYIVDFLKMVKDSTGKEIYAVSTQNEPKFWEPYNSCIYSAEQLGDLVKKTSAEIKSRGLTTKIFGPEHMFKAGAKEWMNLMSLPELHAFAVHGYSDDKGETKDTAIDAKVWAGFADSVTVKKQKAFWMTETITDKDNSQGDKTILALITAFAYGNASWWTWWSYEPNLLLARKMGNAPDSVETNRHYYQTKHFSRFVRPGAQRIESISSDTATFITCAFKNKDGSYVIILHNRTMLSTPSTLTINAPNLPKTGWTRYSTTRGVLSLDNPCSNSGAVDLSNPISMKRKETVTLTTQKNIPVLGVDNTPDSIAAPPPSTKVGELNIYGDDTLDLYLNGQKLDFKNASKSIQLTMPAGDNVIACRLANRAHGGGMLASMHMPNGDTLTTNTSWKTSYVKPPEGWTQLNFDDSQWKHPVDMGGVDIWPGYEKWGFSAINFYYQKARWLGFATKTYFRKTFNNVTGPITVDYLASNTPVRMYANGDLWVSQDSFLTVASEDREAKTATLNKSGKVTIAIALQDVQANNPNATKRGNGVLFKMKLSSPGWSTPLTFDSTWSCSVDSVQNWTKSDFDDSKWFHPRPVEAFSKAMPTISNFYPTTFWVRKKFSTTASGVLNINILNPKDRAVVKQEFYTLQGRLLDPMTINTLKTGSVVLQRTISADNTSKMQKHVIMK